MHTHTIPHTPSSNFNSPYPLLALSVILTPHPFC
jgi:hypothetical protein